MKSNRNKDIDNRIKHELMTNLNESTSFSPTVRLTDAFKAAQMVLEKENIRMDVNYEIGYVLVSLASKSGRNLGFFGQKPTLELAICEAIIQYLDEQLLD